MWVIETFSPEVDDEIDSLPEGLRPHFSRIMAVILSQGLD